MVGLLLLGIAATPSSGYKSPQCCARPLSSMLLCLHEYLQRLRGVLKLFRGEDHDEPRTRETRLSSRECVLMSTQASLLPIHTSVIKQKRPSPRSSVRSATFSRASLNHPCVLKDLGTHPSVVWK